MFPDLISDDIFRIETQHLWLRWPRASDKASITRIASLPEVARMTALIPHPYPPGEAERFIMKARAGNANGLALTLAVSLKSGQAHAIGLISAHPATAADVEIGYMLAPSHWGQGYATEAIKALIDMVFNLTPASRIIANCRSGNSASCRVLEKSGFTFVDSGLDFLPARGGLYPCDRYRLDRKSWVVLRRETEKLRVLPPMAQQAPEEGVQIPLAALQAARRR
ncbi:MAG: GNAT family N-acetyltransferase [Alphaproteobacteria bacterium]|nr:GNAT family N-acetyltransferase [Alphaproteobacteria bacterium]